MPTTYVGYFAKTEVDVVTAAIKAAGIDKSVIRTAVTRCDSGIPLNGLVEVWIDNFDKVERFREEYHARKMDRLQGIKKRAS